MTVSCVSLRTLRCFLEHLFYKAPQGNYIFYVQVAEFQPPDTVKNYFIDAFQVFYRKRTKSSHSKASIFLESLKITCEEICNEVARCQPASLPKKTLSQILLHEFCFHFLRMHNFFIQRGFERVGSQFLSLNFNLRVQLRFD